MKSAILHWPKRPFRHADACHLPRAARGRLCLTPYQLPSPQRGTFSIRPSRHISFPRRCGGSAEHSEAIGAPLVHSTFSRQKATNRPRRPFRHADACHLPRAARGRLFIHCVTIGAPPQSCANRYSTVSIGVSAPVRAEREPAASRLPSISYTARSNVTRHVSCAVRSFAPAIR